MTADREQLRRTFNEEAERYDRARPSYPDELVADLVSLAGIGPGSRVLEIGPGTGQLTVPLAAVGCAITAVELGPALAAVARRNLTPFPGAEVVVSAFEDWLPPAEPFDAVVSATAIHWLDPAIWVTKVADMLRAGGSLATVATHHVAGGTAAFFVDAQDCYVRWDPDAEPGFRLPSAAGIPEDNSDLDGSWLPRVACRRYERDMEYTAAAFADTLHTYSSILAMQPAARGEMLGCIGSLIESRYQGRITKRYLFELRVAQRPA